MDLAMEGRIALVTGATGGIGRAICEILAAEGAIVVAVHRGEGDRLSDLVARIRDAGGTLEPRVADVTEETGVRTLFEELLDRWGRVDILVNNAGVTLERPFLAVTEAEARPLAEVNLWGAYRLMQHALKPMMLARRGVVVNVTSVLASHGGRGVSAYAMTKAALESLTRVLALELAPKGVRLNAVAPGLIETSMSRSLRRRFGDDLLEKIPMRRAGRPEDVGRAVAWLASDAAAYVTGHVLTVDGGYRLA